MFCVAISGMNAAPSISFRLKTVIVTLHSPPLPSRPSGVFNCRPLWTPAPRFISGIHFYFCVWFIAPKWARGGRARCHVSDSSQVFSWAWHHKHVAVFFLRERDNREKFKFLALFHSSPFCSASGYFEGGKRQKKEKDGLHLLLRKWNWQNSMGTSEERHKQDYSLPIPGGGTKETKASSGHLALDTAKDDNSDGGTEHFSIFTAAIGQWQKDLPVFAHAEAALVPVQILPPPLKSRGEGPLSMLSWDQCHLGKGGLAKALLQLLPWFCRTLLRCQNGVPPWNAQFIAGWLLLNQVLECLNCNSFIYYSLLSFIACFFFGFYKKKHNNKAAKSRRCKKHHNGWLQIPNAQKIAPLARAWGSHHIMQERKQLVGFGSYTNATFRERHSNFGEKKSKKSLTIFSLARPYQPDKVWRQGAEFYANQLNAKEGYWDKHSRGGEGENKSLWSQQTDFNKPYFIDVSVALTQELLEFTL